MFFVKVKHTMRTSHYSISISTFLYKRILLNFMMYFHLRRNKEEECETCQDNEETEAAKKESQAITIVHIKIWQMSMPLFTVYYF